MPRRCNLLPALIFYSLQFLLLSTRSFCGGEKSINKLQSIFSVHFTEVFTSHKRIKCFCISDLHSDSEKNQLWVQGNCVRNVDDEGVFTVIILPGDVGSEIDSIRRTFEFLTSCYDAVIFVPGNHEAWRCGIAAGGSATIPDERADERLAPDSVVKLSKVLELAKSCGVFVGPLRVQTVNESVGSENHHELTTNGFEQTDTPRADHSATSSDLNDLRLTPDSSSVTIFPLYSWYHSTWDSEPEINHPDFLDVEEAIPFKRKWGDFTLCSWPVELISQSNFCSIDGDSTVLAEFFAGVNEAFIHPVRTTLLPGSCEANEVTSTTTALHRNKDHLYNNNDQEESRSSLVVGLNDTVISFSHFLPRQELCPEKRFLLEPFLSKVIGSIFLEEQIRRIKPDLHLFGHTHIPIDIELDGIRYVQWPKGYAR